VKFSIIIPAYNERDNIPLVVERLESLQGLPVPDPLTPAYRYLALSSVME